MSKRMKILHLEDLYEDAELVARELKKSGISNELLVVNSRHDFIKGIQEFSPDIILSDHSLPSFNSHEALKITKKMNIRVPFILVTATVSEEYAVGIIREGASDYILKDRLQRLPNAISVAIDKYNLEKENEKANETLQASEHKYRLLFESNPMPMWMVSKTTLAIIDVNTAAVEHYGYSREEFLQINSIQLRPEEDIDRYLRHIQVKESGLKKSGIWRHKKKDGTIILVDILAHDVLFEEQLVTLILANDVTEKLEAEAKVAEQRIIQQKLITETGIKAQEREREMIGKELHDNISQILAIAKLYLENGMIKDNLHSEPLRQSGEIINLAIEEIRKLSHTLVAPSLNESTLVQVIQKLLEGISAVSTLHSEFSTENYAEHDLTNDMKLMFYRIVQEQMNNILKHARASSVLVKISVTASQICLSVTDDGVGFDTGKNSPGIGLRNIINRANVYDGTVQITSSPGKGCTLEVMIPAVNLTNESQ